MNGNRFGAPLAGALVLYLVFASLTARCGHIWSNEAWFASPALTLLHEGYLGTIIVESKGTWMEGLDRHTYWIPPLHLLLQAVWYKVFGFGLISMRSLSMAAGFTLLLAWYWIVARLTASRGIALLAVVIAATDTRVLTFTALGPPDSLCAALGVLGWMAYLRWRDISLPRAILAGNSLAAASCLTHPCGELYAAGLLALTLYYDRGRLGWRNLAGIGLPYVVAVAAWGVYILQAPSQFVTQLLGNVPGVGAEFTGVRRLAGLTSPLAALKREYFLRYGYTFGYWSAERADRIQLFVLLIYTIGVAGCALTPSIRKDRGCRALLLLGALNYVTLAVFDGFKSSGYLLHTLPLATALLAIYARFLYSKAGEWPVLHSAVTTVMIAFFAVQAFTLWRSFTYTPERQDYDRTLAFLRQAGAPPQIIAAGEFAFDLGFDTGMVDDWRLGYFSGKRPPFIVANAIYRGWFIQSATLDPKIHNYMVRLLRDEYHVAFETPTYTVYQRRGAGHAHGW